MHTLTAGPGAPTNPGDPGDPGRPYEGWGRDMRAGMAAMSAFYSHLVPGYQEYQDHQLVRQVPVI